jgi:CBS domain-containing protein
MAIGEICSRDVVFARREESVAAGAGLMRKHHVGCLVIVDEAGGKRRPAGIVTDRDIVLAVVAPGIDAETILLGDVMSPELVAVREDAGVAEVIDLMRLKGVRRLPVVDAAGSLIGLLAADDLIMLLAEEMSGLAAMLSREEKQERISRKSTYA